MRGLIVLLTLAAASCVRSLPLDPVVTVQLDSLFTLRAGQTAIVESTPLRLHFASVVEDSRCPVDVVCVWAGDAQVQVVLTHVDLAEEAIDLHTFLEPRSEVVHGYEVTLERLEPAPHSEEKITQQQYAAEFRVTRDP